MKIDYYASTVTDTPLNIMAISKDILGGIWMPAKSGQHGYKAKAFLQDEMETTRATLLYEGNRGAYPHVYASSDNSIPLSEMLRNYYYDRHIVTRIDVCEDYDNGAEGYDSLSAKLVSYANRRGLKINAVGDWLTEHHKDGRTLYIGAPTSPARVRLYEKGKQIAGAWIRQGIQPPSSISLDWVRLELQYRPQTRKAKRLMSEVNPEDVWGATKWTQEVANKIADMDIPRIDVSEVRQSNLDGGYNWLIKQYKHILKAKAVELGGWNALGLDIGDNISNL